MSVRVMTMVWALDLPDSQKIVLLALADSANDDGHCWPSMASLKKKCSKSERTIQGVIKDLVEAGHLTRNEVLGRGCNYHVHPRSDCAPADSAPPQRLRDTPAAAADKPSRTVIKGLADAKPKRARKPADPEVELPDWLPAEPWAAYLDMRKRKGASPSPHAIGLLIGKLERWRSQGHDPGSVLNNSTENNWTGIFEPRSERNGNHPHRNAATPDRRDGIAQALDRRLGLDEPSSQAGRSDFGDSQGDSGGPAPRLAALR